MSAAAVRSREEAMAEMGQRMLRGERMLAEPCPTCPIPLMESDKGCICSQCHVVYERDGDGGLRRKQGTEKPVAPVPDAKKAPNAAPVSTEARKQSSKVGNVGQALLEGWTMLSESCPICFNPIMRKPSDRSMWCVQCNLEAVTEDNFDKSKQQVATQSSVEAHRVFMEESQRNQTSTPSQSSIEAPKVQNQSSFAHSSDLDVVTSDLKALLTLRLKSANDSLRNISIDNIEGAERLLNHIRSIHETLNSIK